MKSTGYYLLLILALFTLSTSGVAQENTYLQLANQYYNQGQFQEAADYYQKAYKSNKSNSILKNYVSSLTALKQFEQAQKLLKKAIKKQENTVSLYIDLGQVYWLEGNKTEAEKWWDASIKTLSKHHEQIIQTAHAFSKLNQNKYAIEAYLLGKKHMKGFYSYYPQMADIYGLLGDYENMIDLYLELISINAGYQPLVQNSLNRNFDFSEPNAPATILRQRLLQQVQKNPDNVQYAEMYIWVTLKQKRYDAALRQVIALDTRLNENGARLITFARSTKNKEAYPTSINAYQHIINKGESCPFYPQAMIEVLDVKYITVTQKTPVIAEDVSELIANYQKTISVFGVSNGTAPALRQQAKLHALFAQNNDAAIDLLFSVLESQRLDKEQDALTRIDLGDYKLYQNNVWQAQILYLQAEKAFKYDDIGDEAKLRSAKVAYYTGKFAFAKAKLDVLKRSTSKLIANDAMVLSNLITDNTTIDTNLRPMELYATADLMFLQRKYLEGMKRLDGLQEYFPDHMLADEVLMLKSKYYVAQKNYTKAIENLLAIRTYHSSDILADDALMQLGFIHETYLNNPEKAMEYYYILMTEHQDSYFVSEARKNYRRLRGDNV